MEMLIRKFHKNEYISYNCEVNETGITVFKTNIHGERVEELFFSIDELITLFNEKGTVL